MPRSTGQRAASKVPRSHFFSDLIEVRVGSGDGQECFTVQEEVLTAKSSYFRSVLSGEWEEAKSRVVELGDVQPIHFKALLLWLWTGDIGDPPTEETNVPTVNKSAVDDSTDKKDDLPEASSTGKMRSWELPDNTMDCPIRDGRILGFNRLDLVKIWLLADYCDMPELQDHVMDLLILSNVIHRYRMWDRSKYVYDNTVRGSPLRKYIAAWTAHERRVPPEMPEDVVSRFPATFLYDVLIHKSCKKSKGGQCMGFSHDSNLCHFHVHDGEEPSHTLQEQFSGYE